MSAVLSDIVVVELTHVLAGPYCAMMLGDLGAQVIKVERPGKGDESRQYGPPFAAGESAYFLGLNRNKYSIELDFMQPEGKAQLLELLRTATVLVANCRPGSLERKGLSYETLHEINPGLIYCAISSYGQQGPRSTEPGYDLIVQGEAGLMAVTGETDGEPMPVGSSVVDVTAGMYACMAILAALRERDRTGEGQYIHISLLESALTLLANIASSYLISGEEASRYGSAHPSAVPFQTFRTRDGHMNLVCGSDSLFDRLCHVLGRDELAKDERFVTNSQRVIHREELIPILQECFLQRDTADWFAHLRAAGVPCGPIKKVSEALQDAQVQALGSLWECQHPTAGAIQLLGSPLHLSKTPPRLYKAPPLLGEDNALLSATQLQVGVEGKIS